LDTEGVDLARNLDIISAVVHIILPSVIEIQVNSWPMSILAIVIPSILKLVRWPYFARM
jgi:hypothetical protein